MEAVFSNFDEYLQAFGLTLALFAVAGLASMILGLVLATMRVGPVAVLRGAAGLYVTIFRNTPLLVIFIFMAVAAPKLGYTFRFVEEVEIGNWSVSAYFTRACIALTLYTSAFVCEGIRSGVNSVELGQAEAARAVGMTFLQSMRHVVLPQAGRAVIPPLASVQIALAKNTSVAAVFGIAEATATMRAFNNNYADQRAQIFLLFALGYIVIVEIISLGAHVLERRAKVA